ncbi:uncharacterized protein SPPG_02059 [Spizellomyces punctatus DAOM BR117]|uniref:TBC1 domain family member 7 n=1 Tax=Spizellomyces punctatus (strain DAOM BR117) TaxID=645134 RepID=A0A0L0HPU8_SPIPD|nr:hypothetical protein, variant [Spizellomyces punctatus DAOM BR117]XP_016611024.1 uncharacterized protein SPPG_02059 [Spizellomyces punctatus DAOM BR117]KND02984.1 hypothetical protein, variant [Spizellomyces punctatus DAOM BR117]KND02985.1 hypothetical protein SPPG_02059 [Spizellomyces punctatus DAOM BR117]|eukprot:XP_016611023.1 hypothetical protein, variant [Spizellomyces punctatus DAOM BR117]
MSANFRKAYYSSLGVQVVEVKPSLENALQGDILDVERLNKLCLWVRIPHAYRPLVWKVILGTLPLSKDVWPFVEEQRAEQYRDLKECVKYLGGRDKESTPNVMVGMLLVQSDTRPPHKLAEGFSASSFGNSSHLNGIANTMLEICDGNEIDAFWLFDGFVRRFHISVLEDINEKDGHEEERIRTEISVLTNLLRTQNERLLDHILSFGSGLDHYCHSWFRTYFTSVLPPDCLEGIWDILLGGAPAILPYLGLSLLLACKRKIETTRSSTELMKLLQQLDRYVDMDAVASTAIDLWERPILEGMSKETRKALGYNF